MMTMMMMMIFEHLQNTYFVVDRASTLRNVTLRADVGDGRDGDIMSYVTVSRSDANCVRACNQTRPLSSRSWFVSL